MSDQTTPPVAMVPRKHVMHLTDEAHSVMLGMVEHCLNVRACMGMDEGFKSFDPDVEHDFVIELRALLDEPAEQPPGVGGEPETIAWLLCDGDEKPIDFTQRWDVAKNWPEYAMPLVDRAHVAPLLDEIERLNSKLDHTDRLYADSARAIEKHKSLIAQLKASQGEAVAWANGEQLTICQKSPLNVDHPNPIYRGFARNIAGSALKTDYCDTPLYRQAQPVTAKVVLPDIDAAARKMAECMDYPWEYMPEQGRASMREHAKAVIEAGRAS